MELPNTNTKITQNWYLKQIQINLTQSQIRNTNETQEKNTQYEIDTNNKEHDETDFFFFLSTRLAECHVSMGKASGKLFFFLHCGRTKLETEIQTHERNRKRNKKQDTTRHE